MPDSPSPFYLPHENFLTNEQNQEHGVAPPAIGFHSRFLPPYAVTSDSQENVSTPMPPIPDFLTGERIDASENLIEELSSHPAEKTSNSNSTFFDNGCTWQWCQNVGPYPENMVRAGVDNDGSPIFVGRAFHEGDMIPAKIIPSKQEAFICYGGEEVAKDQFEVLRSGAFVWEFCKGGEVAENAIEIGKTSDGEPLYMGRALHQGTQTPGKVQTSHGCLYIPFDGAEVALPEYEMLCIR